MKFTCISFFMAVFFSCLSFNLVAQPNYEKKEPFFKQLELRLGTGGFWHKSTPHIPSTFQVYQGFQSLGLGFYFELLLNDRAALTTGLKTSPGTLFSNSIGIETSNPLYRYDIVTWEFQEWEVPITFKYYFLNGKIKPFVLGNLGLNWSTRFTQFGTHINPLRPPYEEDFRNENIKTARSESFDIGGGVRIDLKENISLQVNGSYQASTLSYGGLDGKLSYFNLTRPVIRAEIYIRLQKWENEEYNK